MKQNVGKFDRLFRITIAAILILLVLSNYILGTWAIVSIVVAIIMVATALFGSCPLYSILNISTKK